MKPQHILWLALAAWGVSGGWPLTAPPRDVWECQRAMMRADGTVPPEAPCVCRARAGLPETAGCKRMRGQR